RPGRPRATDRDDRIVPARLAVHFRRLVRRRPLRRGKGSVDVHRRLRPATTQRTCWSRSRRTGGGLSPARPGFHSVTPRMVVDDVLGQVDFLRKVFDATGDVVSGRPVELRIGDSLVMVSSSVEREPFPAFLYVYVDDADVTFGRAIAAGAMAMEAPLDTPYGDRRAMERDEQ